MIENRVIISNENYFECRICVRDQPDVITAKVFDSFTHAEKAGWIFERSYEKTVAYCPKCRRFAYDG